MKRLYGLVFALFLCTLAFGIQPAEAGNVKGPFPLVADCEKSAAASTVPHSGCYPCWGGYCYEVYPSCPRPKQYSGACIQVIVWAQDPATGVCCEYPNPCSAPDGWTIHYGPGCTDPVEPL
jgi:hypothetical protein